MNEKHISDLVASWIEQGCEDIRSALALYNAGAWSNCSMLAQQCAEKMAKGMILHLGGDLVHTHNVLKLTRSLVEQGGIDSDAPYIKAATELNKAFWIGRYPQAELEVAPFKVFDEDDARRAIEYALLYFDVVVHLLGDSIEEILPGKREEFQCAWESRVRADDGGGICPQ